MPRYRVQISEGISEIVDAESEQEAKNKVRSIIAKGELTKELKERVLCVILGRNSQEQKQLKNKTWL
jgi:chorismate mutase